MSLFYSSPLEQFEVRPVLSLDVVGSYFAALTNHGVYTIVAVGLVLGLHLLASNGYRLVPSRWSVALETAYGTIHSVVRGQIGASHDAFLPFIYTIFMFVLVSNLSGNVPYGYTTTTSMVTTLGLSVAIWVAVTVLALTKHGIHFFSFFVPSGTPLVLVPMLVLIELVSYVARALSLGLRLWANLTAGHTLLKILATFLGKLFTAGIITAVVTLIPFAVFVALVGLELAVSLIQAYVFTVLLCSYLKDAIDLH